jgi:Ca-activated chloride channel homolog
VIFQPVLPWIVLILLGVLLVGGCAAVAVVTPQRRLRWLVRGGAVVLLTAALARPGVPAETMSQSSVSAVDVFIAVDTTASVVAEDWGDGRPRLDGIKEDLRALLEQLPGARVSMVTFDSSAVVRVPLTTDHTAMAAAIETLGPEVTLYSGGSSVTEAHQLLADRLTKAQEQHPENSRLVFYFGDGEQTAQAPPESMTAVGELIDGGAVFGYGTPEGGPMKETQSYYSQDDGDRYIHDPATRNRALSTIDEDQLRAIASDLGVSYAHRSAGAPFGTAYTAPVFEQVLVDEEVRGGFNEFFWIPLLGVFAWVVAEAVIGMHRIRTLRSLHLSLQEAP